MAADVSGANEPRLLRERPDIVVAASPRLFWDGESISETQEFLPGRFAYPLRGPIRHCFLVPSQCVIRREALDRTPGFRALGSEDYDLWLQLLPARPATGGVGYVLEPLVKYRVHAGSSLLDPTGEKRRRLALRHMEVLRLFLQRRDITLYDRLLAMGNIQRKYEQLLGVRPGGRQGAGVAPDAPAEAAVHRPHAPAAEPVPDAAVFGV